jgi:hypothetical protein
MPKKMRARPKTANAACEHKNLVKEYILGSQTGDYICGQCDKVFSPAEASEIEASRTAVDRGKLR